MNIKVSNRRGSKKSRINPTSNTKDLKRFRELKKLKKRSRSPTKRK